MTEPHPDDEVLSAVLDGEGDDAERSHVEGCQACQSRLDDLRAVSRAVAAPVPPPPAAATSAAVDRALAEAAPTPAPAGAAPARRRPRSGGWPAGPIPTRSRLRHG